MKLYIVGAPKTHVGDCVYNLVSEAGELLASHVCSSAGFAPGDLEARRPERQQEWHQRFGDYEVLWLGDDETTEDVLWGRNQMRYFCQALSSIWSGEVVA